MRNFPQSFLSVLVAIFSLAPFLLEGAPKTAVVDVQELFREYHKSVVAQEEINVERARIQKEDNDVKQRIQNMDKAIDALKRRLSNPVEEAERSEEEKQELRRDLAIRIQERDATEGARKTRVQNAHAELNRKMVVRMQAILQEIRHYVEETGRKAGYDYVFDIAGLNTSQVPPVLFAKDATDITAIILKELNKNAPQRR